MNNESIVRRIESEIELGMPRSEVERKLAAIPIDYVYVPRDRLEVIGQATTGNVPLSGRMEISTPYEEGFLRLKRAVVFVDLDEQERVVGVRVERIKTGF